MSKFIDQFKQNISKSQSITTGTLSIIIFTVFSKFLGLVREIVLAANFGTGWKLDALLISMEPALNIGAIFAGNIALVMLPIYIKQKNKNDSRLIKEYTSQMLFISSLFLLCIGFIFLLFPEALVKTFAPNFDGDKLIYATEKMQITSLLPLIQGLNALFASLLQAEKKFLLGSIIQLLFNFITIPLIIFLAPVYKEVSYLYAFITGTLVLNLAYFYSIRRRLSLKHALNFFKNPKVKETTLLAFPLLVGGSLGIVNGIIDNAFASYLDTGSIASMRFAQTIRAMIKSIVVGSLLTTVFTDLSVSVVRNDSIAFEKRLKKTSKTLLSFLIPLTFWFILMSNPLISLLYERGQFNSTSTSMVSNAFIGYSFTLIISPLTNLITRVFTIFKKTKILFFLNVASMLLNIVFNVVLIERFGLFGISLSTSLVALINFIGLTLYQKKHIKFSFMDTKHTCILFGISLSIFITCLLLEEHTNYLIWIVLTNILFFILFFIFNKATIKHVWLEITRRKNK